MQRRSTFLRLYKLHNYKDILPANNSTYQYSTMALPSAAATAVPCLDTAEQGHETASLSLVSSLSPFIVSLGLPSYKHHLWLLAHDSTLCCSAGRTVFSSHPPASNSALKMCTCVSQLTSWTVWQTYKSVTLKLRFQQATLKKFNREARRFATDNRVWPLLANDLY